MVSAISNDDAPSQIEKRESEYDVSNEQDDDEGGDSKDVDENTTVATFVPETAPKIVMKKVKGDQVDEAIQSLLSSKNFSIPVIRISNGKYLIGTESKMCQIKGNSCMVRIGGGFQRIEEYIQNHQDAEMEKIRRLMAESGKTYHQIIIDLLVKFGADQSVVNTVQKQLKLQIANMLKQ